MPTYFGCQTQDGNFGSFNNGYCLGGDYVTNWTCPGSGSQTVVELAVYMGASGTGGNCRMALYDGSGNLVCQHSAKFAVAVTAGWQGVSQGLTGTTTITGGAPYKILFNIEGQQPIPYQQSTTQDGSNYGSGMTFYDAGFPATIPTLGSISYDSFWTSRCGVDPPAGGLSINVADCVEARTQLV